MVRRTIESVNQNAEFASSALPISFNGLSSTSAALAILLWPFTMTPFLHFLGAAFIPFNSYEAQSRIQLVPKSFQFACLELIGVAQVIITIRRIVLSRSQCP